MVNRGSPRSACFFKEYLKKKKYSKLNVTTSHTIHPIIKTCLWLILLVLHLSFNSEHNLEVGPKIAIFDGPDSEFMEIAAFAEDEPSEEIANEEAPVEVCFKLCMLIESMIV